MITNKKYSTMTFVLVTAFMINYTFSRQTFVPMLDAIGLHGFDGISFFSGANVASIFASIYAILQIPYGNMIDRLGLRKSIIILSSLTTIGFGLSTFSRCIIGFGVGRFITAAGCAGAFIAMVKASEERFGQNSIAKVIGITVAAALTMGILFIKFGSPLIKSFHLGWRYLYGTKFLLSLSILLMMIFLIKDKNTPVKKTGKIDNGTDTTNQSQDNRDITFLQFLGMIKSNYYILALMAFSLVFFMIFYGINETSFIGTFYESLGLTKENAYSLLLLGFLLGFLTMPTVAKKLGEMKTCIITSAVLGAGALQTIIHPTKTLLYIFTFLIGYSNGLQMTVVEMATSKLPPSVTGRLSSILNILFVGGVVIAQRMLFFLIPRSLDKGKTLMTFVIGCAILSILLCFLIIMLRKSCKSCK